MPSHSIQGALVQMHHELDGAPWSFLAWKDLTGVRHGLFPADNELLPETWSRKTAEDISSYFDQFRACLTEDAKIKFASSKGTQRNVPGRKAWSEWVTKVWKERKIHKLITDVLSAENIHPYMLASQEDSLESWPIANQWVPLAIDPVGLALFGEQCYGEGVERVRMCLRQTIGALIARTWRNLGTGLKRSTNKMNSLELEAAQSFKDLDTGNLTKAKIRAVILKVMRWKQVASAIRTTQRDAKIAEMMSKLQSLMEALDKKKATVKPTAKKRSKSISPSSSQKLKSLASQEDITDILDLYDDCFNPSAGDTSQLCGQVVAISLKFGTRSDGADPGTEVESTMSGNLLSKNLGFKNSAPILFNTHRQNGGITPWDDPVAFQDVELLKDSAEFTPIELRWHQVAGAHAVLRRVLSAQPSTDSPGMLVADDVGLGKTLQSLAIIAWLTECSGRKTKQGSPLPPILTKYPYLGESQSLEGCHLIVVPGTILDQWESEIRIFLNPKAFDLFTYQSGEDFREDFWSESGPFAQSKQSCANRIILATHSALSQEFKLLFMQLNSSKKELPWRKPRPVATYDSIVKKTLFGLDFLSVTIDEAHEFRNVGLKHSAALEVLRKAKIRLIMTATPLQTSTKDLSGMGRLVGIKFFSSQEAFDEEKADITESRRARASLGEDYDPVGAEENEDDPIRETQIKIAMRIQEQFEQRVLRRTAESKDYLGEKLVKLPKLHQYTALVTLQQFERDIHLAISESMRDELSSCSATKAFSSSFYLQSRMGATYPRLLLTDKIPHFKNLEDWKSRKSTKVDVCVHMCLHLLSRDDAPDMVFRDGEVIFPDLPDPIMPVEQRTKILVYQEFPSFGPLVRNVFTLYGIPHLYIDGRLNYDARAKIVKKFNADDSIRVLFFTSVGATGLNLTRASSVILLDQPWSAQDETQILGRAYRQGQSREVRFYHLLADETSDVVLASLARGKRNMSDSFLQLHRGQELLNLMTEGVVPTDEDDEEGTLRQAERTLQAVANIPNPEASTSHDTVAITHEKPSDKGSLLDAEKINNAPKPKPRRREKATEILESSEKRKGKKPETKGIDARKSLTHLSGTGAPTDSMSNTQEQYFTGGPVASSIHVQPYLSHVDGSEAEVMLTKSNPASSPILIPTIEIRRAPKTPPREVAGQRRGRSQYSPEHDSPEAQNVKKRSRISLLSYLDSPEKQATGEVSNSDSDFEMSDFRTSAPFVDTEIQRAHLAATSHFKRRPVKALTKSLSAANIRDVDGTQKRTNLSAQDHLGAKEIYRSHSAGSLTHIRNHITGKMREDPPTAAILKGLPVGSQAQSFLNDDTFSTNGYPTEFLSTDNEMEDQRWAQTRTQSPLTNDDTSAVDSQIEDHARAQASQEKLRMKSALRDKIMASSRVMDEHGRLRQENLRDFKFKVARDQNNAAAGPSSSTPHIRQPTVLRQSGRLSPPPRSTNSQNPYSKPNKSRWNLG